eukprot:CAMPEP_0170564106 /NCGR_PEP_ID=MMETSP0211-20121228/71035_1 /TAXON_ID=311385 /ORGANISM="Pseudokeronopsis sp., Strain OXSARD2" /LENGTH=72 /DNA_ID=CAMNT_0010883173 /DNA_START=165 /DNA_END=383 /DNA_ORIENTATION=-
MTTKSLSNEILYFVHPNHTLVTCFEKAGMKNAERAFFAVFVDVPHDKVIELKQEIAKHTLGEIADLTEHQQF